MSHLLLLWISIRCFVYYTLYATKLVMPLNCSACRPHSVSRPPSSTSAHYPQSTLGESPSLLVHSKRPSGDGPLSRTKRKKVEAYHEKAEEDATLIPPRAASPATPHVTQQPHHRLTKVMLLPSHIWLACLTLIWPCIQKEGRGLSHFQNNLHCHL